jgi:hypothetical protein
MSQVYPGHCSGVLFLCCLVSLVVEGKRFLSDHAWTHEFVNEIAAWLRRVTSSRAQ